MEKEDTYALLWSREANCFHIEQLHETARSGMDFFRKNQQNDYLLIAFETLGKVDQIADRLRGALIERDAVKQLYSAE